LTMSQKSLRTFSIVLLSAAIAACYTVRNEDMFPIERAPLSDSQVAALAVGTTKVARLIIGDDPALDAYLARVPEARGTVIFFGGNGNEVTKALPNLLANLAPLHLDLVVFNYWATGEPRPTVDSTRIAASRLIQKTVEISSGPVCLIGHSLGSWFALDAASRKDVSNVVLAAIGTTPSDLTIAQAGIWRPFLWHSAEDESLRPLDGVKLARRAVTPILIVTSSDDTDIPPSLSIEVYNSLPVMLDKHLLELHGVSHGGYFRSTELWTAAVPFICRATPGEP
jgi:predicted alpha/beta hydrolase family esterase